MKVYECAEFEFSYDDFSKYYLCHAPSMIFNNEPECITKCKYARKFCPFFKEGKLIGEWKITEDEKAQAINVKKKLKEKGFY